MANTISASLNMYNNMSGVLQGVVNSMNLVISSARNVENATGTMFDTHTLESAQTALNKAGKDLVRCQDAIEKNTILSNKYNKSLREGIGIAGNLKRTIMQIGGAYLGFQGIKNLISLSDDLTGIHARLGLIVDDENTVVSLQDKIFTSAQRSRGEYQVTADIVSKLGMQAKNAFKNNDELIAFSEQLNKNLVISGTNADGLRSVMYNLTQAMASGVLRGQDLNAVMSNAPILLEKIADYLGTDMSHIRKLAEEGKLSAEVIKNALLASADETNKVFENMPMTLEQVMKMSKNILIKGLEPVALKLNKLFNSNSFNNFMNSFISGIVTISQMLEVVLDFSIQMFNILYENWDWLKYIIFGVIGVLGLYKAELFLTGLAHSIVAGEAGILSIAYGLLNSTTRQATLEQLKLNMAMYTSPVFLIPALIISIIAILYGVIHAINKVKGTTYSATGVITGIIAFTIAFILNLFIALNNALVQVIVSAKNYFISFAEFLVNVFKHPIQSIKAMFANLFSSIIGMVKTGANIIDTIFGSSLADNLTEFQTKIDSWKNKQISNDYIRFERETTDGKLLNRFEYGKMYKKGYDIGKNLADKVGSKIKQENNISKLEDLGNPTILNAEGLGNIADTAKNTKGIKDKLDGGIKIENEDLTYLRELATERALTKISLEKIQVDVNNSFGDIHETVDLDGWQNGIVEGLKGAINQSIEGMGAIY